jgi:hypothetical protein
MAVKVRLRWDGADGSQSGWRIKRSPAGAGTWVQVGTDLASSATTYDDTTVAVETAYDYDVVELDGGGVEVANSRFGPIRTQSEAVVSPLPRFGPTGTHWPPNTPAYDGSDSVHDVVASACTGAAIETAISGLTATQVSEGVRILIPAGTLGAGDSKDSPTVSNAGNSAWETPVVAGGFRRVLIRPQGSRDSVKLHYDISLSMNDNVIWAGFAYADSLEIYGGLNTGFARILLSDTASWKIHPSGMAVPMIGLYCGEIVRRGLKISNGDPSGFATTSSADIVGAVMEGHYMSPNYKTDTGHVDTWQADGRNGFYTRDLTVRDCAYFSSTNSAIQCGGVLGLAFDNVYLVASAYQARYGWPLNYTNSKDGKAINGKVEFRDHAMTFLDSVVMGNISSASSSTHPIVSVSNSYATGQSANITTGSFIVDAAMHDNTHPDAPPVPDDAYLDAVWGV